MKLQEIKDAVAAGKAVCWKNSSYEVVVGEGQYFIVCNDSRTGLTWMDGVTLNGSEEDFYVNKEDNEEIKNEIREHAARAFFASAWADMQEEREDSDSMSQLDIMDIMPEDIDPSAYRFADQLIAETEKMNPTREDIVTIYRWCVFQAMNGCAGDRDCNPEMFGHYLAMEAMGHGVGLERVADPNHVKVPYIDYCDLYFDYEYPAFKR